MADFSVQPTIAADSAAYWDASGVQNNQCRGPSRYRARCRGAICSAPCLRPSSSVQISMLPLFNTLLFIFCLSILLRSMPEFDRATFLLLMMINPISARIDDHFEQGDICAGRHSCFHPLYGCKTIPPVVAGPRPFAFALRAMAAGSGVAHLCGIRVKTITVARASAMGHSSYAVIALPSATGSSIMLLHSLSKCCWRRLKPATPSLSSTTFRRILAFRSWPFPRS